MADPTVARSVRRGATVDMRRGIVSSYQCFIHEIT